MNHTLNDVYKDLLLMKEDLEEHLHRKQLSNYVKKLAEEELEDIIWTIKKWEEGYFGKCEETNAPIPEDLLLFQPTVKTIREVRDLLKYFKKPVY